MLISELAKETGLTTDTIRFYEKAGLLDREHFTRSDNNYRRYNHAAVERLVLVKRAQTLGFTLNEIASLIGAWEREQLSVEQKEHFFLEKIAQIDQQIAELEQMKCICAKRPLACVMVR